MRENSLLNALQSEIKLQEHTPDYPLIIKETNIEKCAGIQIECPTIDNVEDFVREYTANELAFFPHITRKLRIEILPSEFNTTAWGEFVSQASGVVKIQMEAGEVELPFLIVDGELVPFDVIQMNGQRIPYSRENIEKVLYSLSNLAKKGKNTQTGSTEDGFIGVEDTVSPATLPGFAGDALSIRDSAMANRHGGNTMMITAGETLDSLLEKVASIRAFTDEEYKKMARSLTFSSYKHAKEEFEKVASETEDLNLTRKDIRQFEKLQKFVLGDVSHFKHGEIIVFPEFNGNEIVMTQAMVLKDFKNMFLKTPKCIIVSSDGRIKVMNNEEKFMCRRYTDKEFHFTSKRIKTLSEGDSFFSIIGDTTIQPLTLINCKERYVLGRTDNSSIDSMDRKCFYNESKIKELPHFYIYSVEPYKDLSNNPGFSESNEDKDYELELSNSNKRLNLAKDRFYSIQIYDLDGKRFELTKRQDYLIQKAGDMGVSLDVLESSIDWNSSAFSSALSKKEGKICTTDKDTKVVKITGVISNNISTMKDFERIFKFSMCGYPTEVIEKCAFNASALKIKCLDRELGSYNISIDFTDNNAKLLSGRNIKYDRIPEAHLKTILKILKYDNAAIKNIIYRAKNEPSVSFPLPYNCTIADIKKVGGNNINNVAVNQVKDAITKIIKPEQIVTSIAATLVSGLAVDSLRKMMPDHNRHIYDTLKKFAGESAELSGEFEKIAMERKSDRELDFAKSLALSHYFFEKVAEFVDDSENYHKNLSKVANDICDNKEVFEKIAYEMMKGKFSAVYNKQGYCDPQYFTRGVQNLDKMVQTASVLKEMKEL